MYPHDPRHYRFTRNTQCFNAIEDATPRGKLGDKVVFWTALVCCITLLYGEAVRKDAAKVCENIGKDIVCPEECAAAIEKMPLP